MTHDPARQFAEAQVREHEEALEKIGLELVANEAEKTEEFKRHNHRVDFIGAARDAILARQERHTALRAQAHQFLQASALPATPSAPRPERAKPGEYERNLLQVLSAAPARPATIEALATTFNLPRDALHAPLRRLVKAGKLVKTGKLFSLPAPVPESLVGAALLAGAAQAAE